MGGSSLAVNAAQAAHYPSPSRSLGTKLTASASAVVRCIMKIRLGTCKIPNHATGGERLSSFAGLLKQQGMA